MKIDDQPKIPVTYEDVAPRKYKLVRESDGLTKSGNKLLWINWNVDGTFHSSHDEIKVGRSSILDPYLGSYAWMTTTVIEIIEQREGYVKFKTFNSIYELFINENNMKDLGVKKCAMEIIDRLCDRNGFNDWWFNLDDDIEEEIMQEIETIIKKRTQKGE
jgi:hypothetical protein